MAGTMPPPDIPRQGRLAGQQRVSPVCELELSRIPFRRPDQALWSELMVRPALPQVAHPPLLAVPPTRPKKLVDNNLVNVKARRGSQHPLERGCEPRGEPSALFGR